MFEGFVITAILGSFVWMNADAHRDLSFQEVKKEGEVYCVIKNNMTSATLLKDGNITTARIKDLEVTDKICLITKV